jgi:3-hydroxyisobutyrate dehydrogenase-like beta-hydroxyacid dehydrogenase
MTTVAIIGAGAMGSGVGRRLVERGAKVLALLEGRSKASRERARVAGMESASLEEIAKAELILSIVPPARAGAVVETLAPVFAGGSPPLFCDANALAPETKRRLAARVAELGGRMVDGTIIGGPPAETYDGPRLYVCGDGAEEVAHLNRFGIDTRVLAGPLGTAATLKMCYGGINKGVIGLVTALLLAAQRHGADEDLLAEMKISQKELLARHARAIPSMYPKAYRWDAEMHEIAGFLSPDDPAAAKIWEGLGEFFTDRAAANEAGEELEDLNKLLS